MKTRLCLLLASLLLGGLFAADNNNLPAVKDLDPLNAVVKINTRAYVPTPCDIEPKEDA